jgi:hypothetical protein
MLPAVITPAPPLPASAIDTLVWRGGGAAPGLSVCCIAAVL